MDYILVRGNLSKVVKDEGQGDSYSVTANSQLVNLQDYDRKAKIRSNIIPSCNNQGHFVTIEPFPVLFKVIIGPLPLPSFLSRR